MNRIEMVFNRDRTEGGRRKALAMFVTAGYPKRDSLESIAPMVEEGGADILEVGMPFSDPLADGPVIQQSSTTALANGMTLRGVLDQVKAVRKSCALPIVLMGYMNPVLRFGVERFFDEAASCGVDGLIFPELPLEESRVYAAGISAAGLSQILLVAPTTPDERVRGIDAASSGFLYCVSTTGTTGTGTTPLVPELLRIHSAVTKNPMLVGFGISTPEDAAKLAAIGDGVIVGSAFVRLLGSGAGNASIRDWVRSFSDMLH